MNHTMTKLELRVTLALAALMVAAAITITVAMLRPLPVCHALSEDSAPIDCHYEHGAWMADH